MATKTMCDGCDAELSMGHHRARNAIANGAGATVHDDIYDLCQTCLPTYRQRSNPRNWPRVVKEDGEAA